MLDDAGAWAEATTRIEFGPLVSAIGYRNPDLTRDPAQIERSVLVAGAPEAVGESLLASGVRLFVLGVNPAYDLSQVEQWIAWRDRH